jgi:hypothetical protein
MGRRAGGVKSTDRITYVTEGPQGEMRLSAYDPEVAAEIALGEGFMDDYRDAFRALAK